MRTTRADSMAATRHAVPEAESQLNVYMRIVGRRTRRAPAASASMRRCSPGHGNFRAAMPELRLYRRHNPTTSTQTTSNANGVHAEQNPAARG